MAQLDVVLSELEAIVNQLREASREEAGARRRLVVAGRQRLAERMRDLVDAAATDPRLAANAQLAEQFSTRMTEWRHAMSQFQAKWRVMESNHDSTDYAASVASLRDSNAAFLGWARGSLANA